MNAIRSSITAILAVFSVIPSLAQPSDFPPPLATTSYTNAQFVTPAVYENSATKNPSPGWAILNQTPDHGSSAKTLWDAARIRTSTLNMEISRTDMVTGNDHASLTTYAPMQAVNGALSFAGYVSQSRMDDSWVTWIQILSLAAKQQINTEFKYSVKMSSYSKFDSVITYRLNRNPDLNRASVIAGLRYNIKF